MKLETINPPRKNGDCWRTLEELHVDGSIVDAPDLYIRAGFEFDGASVPCLFWLSTFTPSDPRVMEAACGHDFIYRNHPTEWTKAKADKWFYKMIRNCGISWLHAQRAYLGLRIGGFSAWKKGGAEK